jgi:hypothetical protein
LLDGRSHAGAGGEVDDAVQVWAIEDAASAFLSQMSRWWNVKPLKGCSC